MFAKLFNIDGFQVLVRKSSCDDDVPCIVIDAEHSFGLADIKIKYDNSEAGEEVRDKAFIDFDLAMAAKGVYQIWDLVGRPDAEAAIEAQPAGDPCS